MEPPGNSGKQIVYRVVSIVGARPQFIKYAPLSLALKRRFDSFCINTGQHYDDDMSRVFFRDFGIPEPDFNLQIGSAPHAEQIAQMLAGILTALDQIKPDAVIVFGDTNSTLAAAIAAAKRKYFLVHVEAGLRSFNRSMPEETNRILTDHVSDLLLAPTEAAINNLKNEGLTRGVLHCPDIMFDALKLALLKNAPVNSNESDYLLATIHRNYNTDSPERLKHLFNTLNGLQTQVVFPIHPRTTAAAKAAGIELSQLKNIRFISPQGYFDFVALLNGAKAVLTDSGGLQKEAYLLKKPCITLRFETEWVETLQGGWNVLIGDQFDDIEEALSRTCGQYDESLFGDGNAADFISNLLFDELERR